MMRWHIKNIKSFINKRFGKDKMNDQKFERILIELKKYIDEKCPDLLELYRGFKGGGRTSNTVGGSGKIEIKLKDNKLAIIISIRYLNYKFDMLTWNSFLLDSNNEIFHFRCPLIEHGEENSLFDNIRKFFEKRDLFGRII